MSSLEKERFISDSERELRDGNISKLFRRFAIPGVVGLLFLGLQNIIDGIILGNFIGANALASVSLILPCYSFIAAVSVVIGIGCQTLISINLGKQDGQGANDSLASGFLFIAGFAIVVSFLIYIFAPNIATMLGANNVLMDGSVNYLHGVTPFMPIIVVMFFGDYILKAMGHPLFSMCIMGSAVIINIILDLVFIAVLEMGTLGAGLATGISFTIGAMFTIPIILGGKNIISFKKGRFKKKLVCQMFYNGSSEGISELSSGITIMLFNIAMMEYLGENGVAAFTALNYVLFIGITIFLGISDGIIPIVSYNFGANKWSRIKKIFTFALKTNFIIGAILFLALSVYGEVIISMFFRNPNPQIMDIATKGTAIYAFAFLLNGFNILSSGYFTAIANAKISIIISILRGLIFVVLGIKLLPLIFGINGIWFAIPIAEALTFIVSILLVKNSFKGKAGFGDFTVF